jgi:hypothetical protein
MASLCLFLAFTFAMASGAPVVINSQGRTKEANKHKRLTRTMKKTVSTKSSAEFNNAQPKSSSSASTEVFTVLFPMDDTRFSLLKKTQLGLLEDATAGYGDISVIPREEQWCVKLDHKAPAATHDGGNLVSDAVVATLKNGDKGMVDTKGAASLSVGIWCCPGHAPTRGQDIEADTCTHLDGSEFPEFLKIPDTILSTQLMDPALQSSDTAVKKAALQIAQLAQHTPPNTVILVDKRIHHHILKQLGNDGIHRVFKASEGASLDWNAVSSLFLSSMLVHKGH